MLDLVETPPIFKPYTLLKARLLDAHQLTDYQKVDQLLKIGDLDARRLLELLAAMLELCPSAKRPAFSSPTCSCAVCPQSHIGVTTVKV